MMVLCRSSVSAWCWGFSGSQAHKFLKKRWWEEERERESEADGDTTERCLCRAGDRARHPLSSAPGNGRREKSSSVVTTSYATAKEIQQQEVYAMQSLRSNK